MIINIQANVEIETISKDDIGGDPLNTTTYKYNKDVDYSIMTTALFEDIINDIKDAFNWDNHFESDIDEDKLQDGQFIVQGPEDEDVKLGRIKIMDFSIKEIAKSKRRIVVLREFQQQGVDFIKELRDLKLYTHPTALNHVYFVEEGFNDIDRLDLNYMDFLTKISESIMKKDKNLTNLKKHYDIKDMETFRLKGNMSNFSFVFMDVLWEVVNYVPQSLSNDGVIYNRDPYVYRV